MKKGITLIEGLVIFAIVGLIATIIVGVISRKKCLESHNEEVYVTQHIEQQSAWIGGHMSIVPILVPGVTTTQTICDKYED